MSYNVLNDSIKNIMFSPCVKFLGCLNILKNKQISKFKRFSTVPNYVQGQSPEKKIREYFYYIDHQGMVG